MSTSPTLELTCALIRRPSITPDDAGCQELIIERLSALGFAIERIRHGMVDTLWAVHGNSGPLLVFAGHTDVVPTGDKSRWHSDPFEPTLREGILYGRGAADMKGSLAAMIIATERIMGAHPNLGGRIGFLITSDEEGPAIDGTARVIVELAARGERIDWCLVGEPSSSATVGDVIKNGRRGSLNATLTVHGTQGHVAYPQQADNPIPRAAPALAELTTTRWDDGNTHFPPTSFQISNISAGTGATNVIPGTLTVLFNFRFGTELTEAGIRERVEAILDSHDLDYHLDWQLSGAPFLTTNGKLVAATTAAIKAITGRTPVLSTAGGTSDGRFIAPTGAQVVELGPVNATIHKVNECVAAADLETLADIYQVLIQRLLGTVS